MKKSLIALAALAAVSAASAQSSVTLYGILDAGYVTTKNQSSVPALNSSSSGVGSSGLSTSRWGIKGSEDLGGGLKANFQLESEINAATGAAGGSSSVNSGTSTATSLFNRVATVGLSGNFGEVKVGRDYTPIFNVIAAGDIFGRTGITAVNLVPTGTRASNMVSYTTPTYAGIKATAMFADNKAVVANAAEGTGRNTGLSATYDNGPLMVGAAWGELKGITATGTADGSVINGQAALGTAQGDKQSGYAISGTYNFGVAKLFANYTQGEITTATAGAKLTDKEATVGVTVPLGAFTLMGAVGNNKLVANYTTTYGAGNVNAKGNDYVLGATYDLSKRTGLYIKTGTYNKVNGTFASVNGDFKTTATAVGVRHTF